MSLSDDLREFKYSSPYQKKLLKALVKGLLGTRSNFMDLSQVCFLLHDNYL
jgi:hypothetical protein